jgi:predicted outer membrane repeat protein
MSNTKHLADLLKVCSILPALAIMPAMADVQRVVITPEDGEAVLEHGISGSTADTDGGAIKVAIGASLNIRGGSFDNNSVYDANNMFGGAIWSYGKLDVDGTSFSGNSATSGGAIGASTMSTGTTIKNSVFTNNHALDGGAVSAFKSLSIENSVFENNTAMYARDEFGNWKDVASGINDPIGGGALALGAESETDIATIAGANFKNNKSGLNGGAIGTRLARVVGKDGAYTTGHNANSAKLDIAATFENNFAARSGGAIYNTFYTDNGLDKGDGVTVAGIFDDNKAGYRGGAIYNDGDLDYNTKGAVMTVNNATFIDNEAGDSGGAIYNTGTLTINGGLFEDNEAGQWAGAIYNSGATDNKDLNMQNVATVQTAGELIIKNATFLDNSAKYAGAVAAGTSAKNTYIENTIFEGNEADEIGALGMFSAGTLKNVVFYNNTATSTDALSDGAGALFLGAVSSTDVDGVLSDSVFDSNTSGARGGAIATRAFKDGNNTAASLDIKNTMFKNNIAQTNGGALDNFFYHSATNADAVYMAGSSFVNNSALNGGAIYNHGSTSTQHASTSVPAQAGAIEINNAQFIGNIATTAGGAIFNESGATVILSGGNTFSGNVAKGLSNDIHNMGTLNITGGKTTFGGGVTGNGTFTLASGELDIGTAAITQGTIHLNGTVVASLLNDSMRGGSYGRFISDNITFGENVEFNLNVGATGTYNIWNGKIVDAAKVIVGDIYEIEKIDKDGVKIVTKSVADIAEKVGITTQAAGAVAGLANASSGKAHQVSLALQEALNTGDAEYVERETKKLNPTDKPVAQAAAASVQNQVLALTSGRMAGGVSIGRAGGDEKTQENGFWIQGLFNKSKFADDFHGYTRGVALGADTTIDKTWTVGGGLAFNNSDIHADAGHTDISSKTLFLYGQYKPSKWFVNATATYSMSEYTENKTVAGVSGLVDTYDVDAYGVQMMAGYDFTPGITTEAGLRYLHVAQDSYVDAREAQIMATDTNFLSGVAGLKYAFAIENDWAIQLRPELRAAMTYDFISDDTATTVVMPGTEAYAVNGERLSRMGGEFGIGLTAQYKGMEVSLMYDLDLHRDYTSQTGMIKFRGRF